MRCESPDLSQAEQRKRVEISEEACDRNSLRRHCGDQAAFTKRTRFGNSVPAAFRKSETIGAFCSLKIRTHSRPCLIEKAEPFAGVPSEAASIRSDSGGPSRTPGFGHTPDPIPPRRTAFREAIVFRFPVGWHPTFGAQSHYLLHNLRWHSPGFFNPDIVQCL
jgi:hypothetical protein